MDYDKAERKAIAKTRRASKATTADKRDPIIMLQNLHDLRTDILDLAFESWNNDFVLGSDSLELSVLLLLEQQGCCRPDERLGATPEYGYPIRRRVRHATGNLAWSRSRIPDPTQTLHHPIHLSKRNHQVDHGDR